MGLFHLDANYILHLQQKSNSVMRNKETRFFIKCLTLESDTLQFANIQPVTQLRSKQFLFSQLVRPARNLSIVEGEASVVALVSGGDGVEEESEGVRAGDDRLVLQGGEQVELGPAEPGVGHRAPTAVLASVRDDQVIVGTCKKKIIQICVQLT